MAGLPPQRPQGLTIVGIACLVVGLLSTCCNLYGLVGAGMQIGMGAFVSHGGLDGDPQTQQMFDMQRELGLLAAVPAVLGVIVALTLVAGGGLALTMKPVGRPLVIGALVAAVVVSLLETGVGAWSAHRMSGLLGGLPSSGASPFGGSGAIVAISIASSVAWLAVKLAAYTPCLVYMLRRDTAAIFASRDALGPRGE